MRGEYPYREESKNMVQTILDGRLMEKASGQPVA